MKNIDPQDIINLYLKELDVRTDKNTMNLRDVINFIIVAYDKGRTDAFMDVLKLSEENGSQKNEHLSGSSDTESVVLEPKKKKNS